MTMASKRLSSPNASAGGSRSSTREAELTEGFGDQIVFRRDIADMQGLRNGEVEECAVASAGSLQPRVGSVGMGSNEVRKIFSPSFAYGRSVYAPGARVRGGVTTKRIKPSPAPENSTGAMGCAVQPSGVSGPIETLPGLRAVIAHALKKLDGRGSALRRNHHLLRLDRERDGGNESGWVGGGTSGGGF